MTPPVGPRPATGERVCHFTAHGRRCTRPAEVHILLTDDGHHAMTCRQHLRYWMSVHLDTHSLVGECGLPGTTWVESTSRDQPGRCIIEGLDLPDLFATADELAGRAA